MRFLIEDYDFDWEDMEEEIDNYLKNISLKDLKEILEEYDGTEDLNYLEDLNKWLLEDDGPGYANATKEDLMNILDYEQKTFIFDNYIDTSDLKSKYDREAEEEQEYERDKAYYGRPEL